MADQLANRIRQARTDAALSREHVAAALGVSLSTIVRWETGRTKRVSLDQLVRVGQVTGQQLAYFLEDEVAA